MTEKCNAQGSILKLVTNKWKAAGDGKLTLIQNPHNPQFILIKIFSSKKNTFTIFQCKAKAKPKNKALILKGTHTRKGKESVLAVRFKESNSMKAFQSEIEKIQRHYLKHPNQVKSKSRPPKDKHEEAMKEEWDCILCSRHNSCGTFDCIICNAPRSYGDINDQPMMIVTDSIGSGNTSLDLPQHQMEPSNVDFAGLPEIMTPKSTSNDGIKSIFPQINGIDEQKETEPAKNVLVILDEEMKDDIINNHNGVDNKDKDKKEDTIKGLIISVTSGKELYGLHYTKIQSILLLCHDTFVQSSEMLNVLLSRCKDPKIDFVTRGLAVNMLQEWMNGFWESDFSDKDVMLDTMDAFIAGLDDVKSLDFIKFNDKHRKLLARVKSTFNTKYNEIEVKKVNKIRAQTIRKIAGAVDVPKNYNIMKQAENIIAEQLTLMDFDIFSSIARREMLGQGWKKKNKHERSPRLLAMIKQFNQISKWVGYEVLSCKNKRARSKLIAKYIRIAVKLRELRNFSGCCAINFGLSATPIYRQKEAWNQVPAKDKQIYTKIQQIYKGQQNWASLRVLHQNAYAPSILHTGLFLQDLLNTDEGNTDENKDGTVNFIKLKATYNLIESICMYQSSSYKEIRTNLILQQALKQEWSKLELINENTTYAISTLVKQRDIDGKDIDPKEIDWYKPKSVKK